MSRGMSSRPPGSVCPVCGSGRSVVSLAPGIDARCSDCGAVLPARPAVESSGPTREVQLRSLASEICEIVGTFAGVHVQAVRLWADHASIHIGIEAPGDEGSVDEDPEVDLGPFAAAQRRYSVTIYRCSRSTRYAEILRAEMQAALRTQRDLTAAARIRAESMRSLLERARTQVAPAV